MVHAKPVRINFIAIVLYVYG